MRGVVTFGYLVIHFVSRIKKYIHCDFMGDNSCFFRVGSCLKWESWLDAKRFLKHAL